MKSLRFVGSIILVLVLVAVAGGLYSSFGGNGGITWPGRITDFESCAAAGNPVMESYPRQCNTKDGRHFVEDIKMVPPTETSGAGGGCMIGGCSAQLCGEASDEGGLVSDCVYRPQYACYRGARCERQIDGKCGWTDTPALRSCLMSATSTTSVLPTDISVN